MPNNITLSRSIRENLHSLQGTAELLSQTQKRLSTGRKVNSALDNPANFFTSQGLSSRANDLNSLLDAIGQAQKTLDAADKGISSLTTLVESAKSIAKQARQTTSATYSYAAVSRGGTTQNESAADHDGAAITVANSTAYSFNIDFGDGSGVHAVSYTSDGSATFAEILAGIQASFATAADAAGLEAGTDVQLVEGAATGDFRITALKSDVDFTISGNSGAGLTNAAYTSTSLLDRIVAAGGADGDTLEVRLNGGAVQTLTFGTGAGEISTLEELNTAIDALDGIAAGSSGVSGSNFGASRVATFAVASGSDQTSVSFTASHAGVGTALGFSLTADTASVTSGAATLDEANSTRASLQSDYNTILEQITSLAQDSSYNGINLLNGDDLSVIFNEDGTSSLDINGVTFNAGGLGLGTASSNDFQTNATIDTFIAQADAALSSLRTQASRFGSSLTTVQARQDFTKNLVSTLQTGSDALVLADSNEEAANLLALQTRQQLSQTALSLANQQEQSILRLF